MTVDPNDVLVWLRPLVPLLGSALANELAEKSEYWRDCLTKMGDCRLIPRNASSLIQPNENAVSGRPDVVAKARELKRRLYDLRRKDNIANILRHLRGL